MTKDAVHSSVHAMLHGPLRGLHALMHAVDAWLWRSGIHHPEVRAILRSLTGLSGMALICGALLSPLSLWPLWFALGSVVFFNVFWGMARHLLRVTLTAYSFGLLAGVLVRSAGRLLFTAAVLYVALIVCSAPAVPLVCGLIAATAVALGTYALAGARAGQAGHNKGA